MGSVKSQALGMLARAAVLRFWRFVSVFGFGLTKDIPSICLGEMFCFGLWDGLIECHILFLPKLGPFLGLWMRFAISSNSTVVSVAEVVLARDL